MESILIMYSLEISLIGSRWNLFEKMIEIIE